MHSTRSLTCAPLALAALMLPSLASSPAQACRGGLALTLLGGAFGDAAAGEGPPPSVALVREKDVWLFDVGEDVQRALLWREHLKPSKVRRQRRRRHARRAALRCLSAVSCPATPWLLLLALLQPPPPPRLLPLLRQMHRIVISRQAPDALLGLPGALCVIGASREKGHEVADIPVHVFGPEGTAEFLAAIYTVSLSRAARAHAQHAWRPLVMTAVPPAVSAH